MQKERNLQGPVKGEAQAVDPAALARESVTRQSVERRRRALRFGRGIDVWLRSIKHLLRVCAPQGTCGHWRSGSFDTLLDGRRAEFAASPAGDSNAPSRCLEVRSTMPSTTGTGNISPRLARDRRGRDGMRRLPRAPLQGAFGWRAAAAAAVLAGVSWTWTAARADDPPGALSTPLQQPETRPVGAARAPHPLVEEIPPFGKGNMLSESQIRYCLAEFIRIEAVRPLMNRYRRDQVEFFNTLIAAYNSRCAKYRYELPDMDRARHDVETNRSRIEADAQQAFVLRFQGPEKGPDQQVAQAAPVPQVQQPSARPSAPAGPDQAAAATAQPEVQATPRPAAPPPDTAQREVPPHAAATPAEPSTPAPAQPPQVAQAAQPPVLPSARAQTQPGGRPVQAPAVTEPAAAPTQAPEPPLSAAATQPPSATPPTPRMPERRLGQAPVPPVEPQAPEPSVSAAATQTPPAAPEPMPRTPAQPAQAAEPAVGPQTLQQSPTLPVPQTAPEPAPSAPAQELAAAAPSEAQPTAPAATEPLPSPPAEAAIAPAEAPSQPSIPVSPQPQAAARQPAATSTLERSPASQPSDGEATGPTPAATALAHAAPARAATQPGTRDITLARFERDIRKAGTRVIDKRRLPELGEMGRNWSGKAQIEVQFAAGGYISRIVLAESCGHPPLDEKALEIARSILLPPVPKELSSRDFSVRFPIEFRSGKS